jgi:hypothetical protein
VANSHVFGVSQAPALMAAFLPYENQRGHDKFERFVMAGVHHNSNEYICMTKLGEEPTDLQSLVHSIQGAHSAAATDKSEQAFNKALANARRHQKNEEFEAIAGLHLGRSVSTADVDDLVNFDGKDDNVVVVGDGLDGSGLSSGGEQENSTQRPCTSSLGAQPTARGGRG